MADSYLIKAQGLQIEGNYIALPSHVDIVDGLDDRIWSCINDFDRVTLNNELEMLDDVYLGISDTAVAASTADSAAHASYAVRDDLGRSIAGSYYTTDATVAYAAADPNGDQFTTKYAKKDGSYIGSTGMTVHSAEIAGSATKASQDANGSVIRNTYINNASISGKTLTLTRPDNSRITLTTQDTTYNVATTSANGLMSAADKSKLDSCITSSNIGSQSVSYAGSAGQFKNAQKYTLTGGATGSFEVTGSNAASVTTAITVANINANSITSGILSTARGGTGTSTPADSFTAKYAKQFDSNRTVSIGGAVSGSSTWNGAGNLAITANNIDLSKVNNGTLSKSYGGTGNTSGYAQGLENAININGINTQLTQNSSIMFSAVCNTAANVAKKEISITGIKNSDGFFVDGTIIAVQFTYQNTASSPYLYINNTGSALTSKILCEDKKQPGIDGYPAAFYGSGNNRNVLFQYRKETASGYWLMIGASPSHLLSKRNIGISGAVSGTAAQFDGSADVSITGTKIELGTDSYFNNYLGIARGGTGNTVGGADRLSNMPNLNGVKFDGKNSRAFFASCSTAADVQTKVITFDATLADSSSDPFGGVPQVFAVHFQNANTADSPMLNINNTGAKNIRRGNVTIQTAAVFSAYNNQVVWFQRVDSGNSILAYRIIDSSQFTKFSLTGDVTGEATVSNSAYLTIRTKVDPTKAFDSVNITSDTDVIGTTVIKNTAGIVDLDLISESGFYRLLITDDVSEERTHIATKWAHLPDNLTYVNSGDNRSFVSYMQVLKSSSSSTFIQILYPAWSSDMFVRAAPNGSPLAWKWMTGTARDYMSYSEET